MKEIELTQGKIALVDDEDYEFLNQWKWYAVFRPQSNCFYAARQPRRINGKRKLIYMARVILNINDPKILVDHINHDTLNNLRSNLRVATGSQNQANSKPRKNSSSKYLGVNWFKRDSKWNAHIRKEHKLKYLGSFTNEIDAALAYNKSAIELHGEFANLNKI